MNALRAEVARTARALHAAGWVANHDGNVTARDGARLVATPTATSKRDVAAERLIEVDLAGKVIGAGKVFGEIGLHTIVYERRPDIAAVVHAHPPCATAIASSRGANLIERPFIAEAVVSLGPLIPRVAFAAPGDAARVALAPWCELVDVVLLGNHGAIAWGASCEQALLRLELVEHLAKMALAAAPVGGIEALPAAAIAPLLAARAKAGIGAAADRAVDTAARLGAAAATAAAPVVACAPAPHSPVATLPPGGASLADVVREEIVRALRNG